MISLKAEEKYSIFNLPFLHFSIIHTAKKVKEEFYRLLVEEFRYFEY